MITPSEQEGSDRRGWQVDKKVSVQHLFTVLAMLIGGITAFNALSKDVAINAVRVTAVETQSIVLKTDITSTLNELKAEIRDLRNEMKLSQLRSMTKPN